MYCPNCGTQNADTNKFCLKCGSQLPGQNVFTPGPAPVFNPMYAHPADPVSQAATIGGICGIAGGGLTLLGWFVPWFSLGGLVGSLLSLFNASSGSSLMRFGVGVGNGLQITLLSLTAGFAALSSKEEIIVLIGLICLVLAAVLIAMPITAITILSSGFRTFEISLSGGSADTLAKSQKIKANMESVKGKSATLFAILAVFFILMAAIPFGTAVLGSGFYLTALGVIVSYVGAYFARSKVND